MKITVFGSGYVGLVTGACFAEAGNQVLCVDTDAEKIAMLKNGQSPIFESGLEALIQRNLDTGNIRFTTDIEQAVNHGLFQFIAVGTPPDEDGSADLQYVLAVADNIAEYMNKYRVIINKSTVPVGTADKVKNCIQKKLQQRSRDIAFDVVSNPEFLKEGVAINDFMKPDRIVVGVDNANVTQLLRRLYAPFNRNHDRLIVMDVRSSELTKYAANAMLATKISFMNEMANLAEQLGADIEKIRQGIGSDSRIGYHFIYAGCGYGGSCFPKDVKALERMAQEINYDAQLIRSVESVNQQQKQVIFNKISKHFNGNLEGKIIALWGLAFKPNTDDMREAPSRILLEALIAAGAKVQAYDPKAMSEARRLYLHFQDFTLCSTAEEAVSRADALAVMTEWRIFWNPDLEDLKRRMKTAVIFDGRDIDSAEIMKIHDIRYYGIGR